MWESWDYYELEYGFGYDFDLGYDTKITITGEDANFHFHSSLGDDKFINTCMFKFHKNVTVYGSLPSNKFNAANVEIDNFSFRKTDNPVFGQNKNPLVLNIFYKLEYQLAKKWKVSII